MALFDRIIELRTAAGLTQSQLAKCMDVSRQAVSKWENGLSTPDPGKMIQLAEILNADLAYLATGQIQESPDLPEVIEKIVEVPVEVPVIQYVDRVSVKRVIRKERYRNPVEYALIGLLGLIVGLLIGILL